MAVTSMKRTKKKKQQPVGKVFRKVLPEKVTMKDLKVFKV